MNGTFSNRWNIQMIEMCHQALDIGRKCDYVDLSRPVRDEIGPLRI